MVTINKNDVYHKINEKVNAAYQIFA